MKLSKKIFWVLNFSVLGLFSLYALSGVMGFGVDKAYADTLNSGNFFNHGNNFVVVHGNGNQGSQGMETTQGEQICSITPTQEAELNAFFNVKLVNITVKTGQTVQIAVVNGRHLTKDQLMAFLKASNQSLDCQIVSEGHIFFLPVLPQIS